MNTDDIDFALPIKEIARKKIAYHESEIIKHQKEIAHLKSQFNFSDFDFSIDKNSDDNNYTPKEKVNHTEIKKEIIKLFDNDYDKKLTTGEVFDFLSEQKNIDPIDRTTWIIAISQSFRSLRKFNQIKAEKIIGEKGNYYKLQKSSLEDF